MSTNMQQKMEERKLETTINDHIDRVNDIKSSINALLWKINHDPDVVWPSVLDSFALLSSQLSSFQKLLANDKVAVMKNYTFIPLLLSQDRDADLEKLTDGRISSFNHEIVPDYLRTKPEVDVENKMGKIIDKASTISSDATTKQINQLNKACANVLQLIQSKRDEWRGDEGLRKIQESSSHSDTMALVAATTFGRNLIDPMYLRPGPSQGPMSSQMMNMSSHPQHLQRTAPIPNINMHTGKAPSVMKPNIRMHSAYPYPR